MVQKWIDAFNKADIEMIAGLYANMPITPVANKPVVKKHY
jgi:hypothetical protein